MPTPISAGRWEGGDVGAPLGLVRFADSRTRVGGATRKHAPSRRTARLLRSAAQGRSIRLCAGVSAEIFAIRRGRVART